MKARTACLAALAIGLGAAPHAIAQEPPVWRLSPEPLLEIGVVEGDPAYQLFDALSSVRLEDGRIVVLNAGSHQLRIYDADGRIIRTTGGEGAGPGEFRAPTRLYRRGSDSLVVYDRRNTRFSVHTLDGAFVRTEPAPYDRGRFPFDEWLYDRSWIDGPPLGRGRAPVRAAIDELPPPHPDVGYRYVKLSPQGHLWVRGARRPGSPVQWTVYDLDARPIGRVATPARFEIHEIGRDYLLGVGRDELDVEYIRLFALSGAEDAPSRPIVGAAGAAGAEDADGDAAGAPRARALPAEAVERVQAAIRTLAARQEMFYASGNFRYARTVDEIEEWELPEGLVVRIVRASDRGWTGLIIDERTGATCGLTYGSGGPVGWMPGVVSCE